jgi:hypothetical protein
MTEGSSGPTRLRRGLAIAGFLFSLALEVARHLSFPLALAALVLIFVAGQTRIDRREPKLALASPDPAQDRLDFD